MRTLSIALAISFQSIMFKCKNNSSFSLQLRYTHDAIQKDRAILVRWFTHCARTSVNDIDGKWPCNLCLRIVSLCLCLGTFPFLCMHVCVYAWYSIFILNALSVGNRCSEVQPTWSWTWRRAWHFIKVSYQSFQSKSPINKSDNGDHTNQIYSSIILMPVSVI